MLLGTRDLELERRLAVLHATAFPPGSRSVEAVRAAWRPLAASYFGCAFIYGTGRRALVYTYEGATNRVVVEAAIVDGAVVP
jgi:hypothetical protein